MGTPWNEYRLTEFQIEREEYKSMIGGGLPQFWDKRGKFQLTFMKSAGLQPSHTLLDIGCGPLRAGIFFIEYLDADHYHGFDYNKDFIKAGKHEMQKYDLQAKNPSLYFIKAFEVIASKIPKCDYGIVFSVLNHCVKKERMQFFSNIHHAFNSGAKIYTFMSNDLWINEWKEIYYKHGELQLTNEINDFKNIEELWGPRKGMFPILEFTRE